MQQDILNKLDFYSLFESKKCREFEILPEWTDSSFKFVRFLLMFKYDDVGIGDTIKTIKYSNNFLENHILEDYKVPGTFFDIEVLKNFNDSKKVAIHQFETLKTFIIKSEEMNKNLENYKKDKVNKLYGRENNFYGIRT